MDTLDIMTQSVSMVSILLALYVHVLVPSIDGNETRKVCFLSNGQRFAVAPMSTRGYTQYTVAGGLVIDLQSHAVALCR